MGVVRRRLVEEIRFSAVIGGVLRMDHSVNPRNILVLRQGIGRVDDSQLAVMQVLGV